MSKLWGEIATRCEDCGSAYTTPSTCANCAGGNVHAERVMPERVMSLMWDAVAEMVSVEGERAKTFAGSPAGERCKAELAEAEEALAWLRSVGADKVPA